MASYLRPRRGKKATAEAQNIILKRGEVFFEVPTTGVGTGIGKIKIGDGTSTYKNLPYFLEQPTINVANTAIAFTENSSTNNSTLLSTIVTGAKLNVIIGAVKKLLSNLNSSVTKLNNDLASFQNGVDTIYNGCKTYGNTPTASTPSAIVNSIKAIYTDRYNAGVSAGKKNYKITVTMSYKSYNGSNQYQSTDQLGTFYIYIRNGVVSTNLTGYSGTDFNSQVNNIGIYAMYTGWRLVYVSSITIEEI